MDGILHVTLVLDDHPAIEVAASLHHAMLMPWYGTSLLLRSAHVCPKNLSSPTTKPDFLPRRKIERTLAEPEKYKADEAEAERIFNEHRARGGRGRLSPHP